MVCKEKPTLKYCHWYPANSIISSINFAFLTYLNYVPTPTAYRPVTLYFYQVSWSIPTGSIPALNLGSSDFVFLHVIHPTPPLPLPYKSFLQTCTFFKVQLKCNLCGTFPKSPVYTDIPFIQVPLAKHHIASQGKYSRTRSSLQGNFHESLNEREWR